MEGGMALHSSTLAWRIPWTREAWGTIVHRVANSQTRLSDQAQSIKHPKAAKCSKGKSYFVMISTHFSLFGSKLLWRWRRSTILRKTERLKGNKKGDYKEYVQSEKNKLSRDAVSQAERMERQRWNTAPLRENEVEGENVRRSCPP